MSFHVLLPTHVGVPDNEGVGHEHFESNILGVDSVVADLLVDVYTLGVCAEDSLLVES